MSRWIEIRDGGRLLYEPDFYSTEEAGVLFAWLRGAIPWRQEAVRGNPLPRLNAWFADAGLRYSYSGLSHCGAGWLAQLAEIKQRVEAASAAAYNSLLLNLYRDGRDSIGFHTDAEPELGVNPVVATLSFGAAREFVLKHKATKEVLRYNLASGSLLVMGGSSQHSWLHAVPRSEAAIGERISLTFRQIVSVAE